MRANQDLQRAMRRNIQQEIARATSGSRRDDVVAARHTITRTDLIDGPITLAQKGIYSLSASLFDVRFSQPYEEVILIAASNVELNLSGFEISLAPDYVGKVPANFALVRLAAGVQQVFIKSGTLRNAPIGIAGLNNRKIKIADVTVEGVTRKGFELLGLSGAGSEVARCRATVGAGMRSERYEHAYQLLRYVLENRFRDPLPPTLVSDLELVLENEDANGSARPETDGLSGTTEGGAVALELCGSGNVPAQSVLVDNLTACVVAEPAEAVGVLYDGRVVRDDASYMVRWSSLSGRFEDSRDAAIFVAQLWIATQTGSMPDDFLWACAQRNSSTQTEETREGVDRILARCAPLFGGDFRGTPLEPPTGVRFALASNCHLKRVDVACANLLEDDGRDVERASSAAEVAGEEAALARQRFRDSTAVAVSEASSSTLESITVVQSRSVAGWATGIAFEGECPLNIVHGCRLQGILSIPARETAHVPSDVRAVGVSLPTNPKDLKIENLHLDQQVGEISCGASSRGLTAFLFVEPGTPGKPFNATFGQTVLGVSDGVF